MLPGHTINDNNRMFRALADLLTMNVECLEFEMGGASSSHHQTVRLLDGTQQTLNTKTGLLLNPSIICFHQLSIQDY